MKRYSPLAGLYCPAFDNTGAITASRAETRTSRLGIGRFRLCLLGRQPDLGSSAAAIDEPNEAIARPESERYRWTADSFHGGRRVSWRDTASGVPTWL